MFYYLSGTFVRDLILILMKLLGGFMRIKMRSLTKLSVSHYQRGS